MIRHWIVVVAAAIACCPKVGAQGIKNSSGPSSELARDFCQQAMQDFSAHGSEAILFTNADLLEASAVTGDRIVCSYQSPEGIRYLTAWVYPAVLANELLQSQLEAMRFLDTGREVEEHHSASIDTDWRISREQDALTDSTNVFATLVPDNTVFSSSGLNYRPLLTISCYENQLQIYIRSLSAYMGRFGRAEVDFRIDDAVVESSVWRFAESNDAIGFYETNESFGLIQRLASADRFVVRYTPPSNNAWTIEYTLAGISDVVDQVMTACG